MDRATQDYYESLIDLFATDGWKEFKRDFTETLRNKIEKAYEECPDADSWQKRRGEIEQLSGVVGYEDFIRQSYEQLDDPV